MLKRLGKVLWFQYKTAPQKNKGVSQKNQKKNFVKKRITKYFGGSDPINELIVNIGKTEYKVFKKSLIHLNITGGIGNQ